MLKNKKLKVIKIGKLDVSLRCKKNSIVIFNGYKWNTRYPEEALYTGLNIFSDPDITKKIEPKINRMDNSFYKPHLRINTKINEENFSLKYNPGCYFSKGFFHVLEYPGSVRLPFVLNPPFKTHSSDSFGNRKNIRVNNKIIWFDHWDFHIDITLKDKKKKTALNIRVADLLSNSNNVKTYLNILIYFMHDELHKAEFLKTVCIPISKYNDDVDFSKRSRARYGASYRRSYELLTTYEKIYMIIVYFTIHYAIMANEIKKTKTLKISKCGDI